jgi:hypothetical protein
MMTNNTRSWMNMINLGSTITDEAWSTADKSNEDWNHAWGSAPGNLIPRYVLGLRPLAAGYGQILIQPHLGTTLSFAQGTVPTIRGPVSMLASNAPGQFQLLATIPGNVTATVMLPATNSWAILDGAMVSGTLSTDSLANTWLTITNIGSGQHAIWASSSGTPATTTLYNNWASSWFGTNAANPAVAGPNADPDGDGSANWNEFIAGTDPLDAADCFRVSGINDPQSGLLVTVTLNGKAQRHYTLQHTVSLAAPNWIPVETQTATSDNQTIVLTDSPLDEPTFLRVAVDYP